MSSHIQTYLQSIATHLQAGNATEHTHRPALQILLSALLPNYRITNEPRRIACGSPDFEIAKDEVPLGHIEAKDVGVDLDKVQKSEQLKRYLESLNNLLLTDYLEFRWFVDGEYQPNMTVRLAEVDQNGKLKPHPEACSRFETLLETLVTTPVITLRSPEELAKKMAHLARLMREVMLKAYQQEDKTGQLHGQYESFCQVLIDTLTPEQFTDMLAQTICYGLFAAKCSMTPPSPPAPLPEGEGRPSFDSPLPVGEGLGVRGFSRQNASHFVPKTNPFLRNLFNQIAGIELDDRLVWMVDHLIAVLNRADLAAILENFGKRTRQEDPVVHFYETFLAHYDAKLREVRGVYYTPEPVVSYIVRSVDWVLKEKFSLKQGLADNTQLENNLHQVQILDPATGTGTFLYAVIAKIYDRFRKNQGMWSDYVAKHLLPRVHGFELLMAPYTVAHLKLSLQLQATGYDFRSEDRLRVFLTNTLDEPHHSDTTWLAKWLSDEANAASGIKQQSPVMVILGNPPYSGHSANTGVWINELLRGIGDEANYFMVDGKPLKERNPKWLNDDYVKFIRFAQWRIMQTGYGVLAFVTNHGYLDNPTFRGMRQALLQAFDEIYILDLHGNSKKKEKSPDGGPDQNVFDIQQGVAIGIFVKHRPSPPAPLPEGEGSQREGSQLPPLLLENARALQKSLTDAEQVLWSILRGKQFLNLKFRRQHPISPYILDFYCHELKLAIEVDGRQHDTDKGHASDANRTSFLSQFGITVLRFWNHEVLQQLEVVLEKIYVNVMELKSSPPSPSGRGAGGEGKVHHAHSYGTRAFKYEYLMANDIKTTPWTTLQPQSPFYLLVPQNVDLLAEYEPGWKVTEMMPVNSVGIVTARDSLTIQDSPEAVMKIINDFVKLGVEEARDKYKLGPDARDWKVALAQNDIKEHGVEKRRVVPISYRPFDTKFTFYTGRSRGFLCMPRPEVMQHMLMGKNLGLIAVRKMPRSSQCNYFMVTDQIISNGVIRSDNQSIDSLFPLYLYPSEKDQFINGNGNGNGKNKELPRKPNFSEDFIKDLETRLNLQLIPEGYGDFKKTISALDVFNYLYAVFHSPTYRQRYAEFLKIDFPRLSLTSDKLLFKQLAELGGQLVKIHLMEAEIENDCSFPIKGSNLVEKLMYQEEKVYINQTQYFDHVTPDVWEFHIGGYQVCEKWLKDRKGRVLSFEECSQYLYILAALEKTRELMERIDEVIGEFPIH